MNDVQKVFFEIQIRQAFSSSEKKLFKEFNCKFLQSVMDKNLVDQLARFS